ncbi:MAG: bifunctional transaldolase/phosoglucose isomerase [Nitrospira sp.]
MVLLKKATHEKERAKLEGLQGKIAVANAKLAYQRYQGFFSGSRWDALARQGATSQRLLWASTGTKNSRYRDVRYVEELIGPETVNTVPPATLDAFRDHGHPASRLTQELDEAKAVLIAAEQAGISLTAVTDRLLNEGLQSFCDAFDHLLVAVESQVRRNDPVPLNSCSYSLPADLTAEVQSILKEWNETDRVQRLWNHDPSLWTDGDEHRWLGWLDITDQQLANVPLLSNLAQETWRRGFTHVLLLGMGGSSFSPEVLRMTFGRIAGYPELHVLDSTDPAQIRTVEKRIRIASTLFIVSSKSGSTLEPMILKHYFFERVQRLVGAKAAVRQFIAITDPGSPLQQIAEANDFRHLYFGVPTIGGRYSALSNFGMVPAAVMGLDIAQFLESAEEMVEACFPSAPVEENPGLILGMTLGALAKHGRDKVTIVSSSGLASFGAWLEQLLAESTGKAGKGIIPVDRETVGDPAVYGADRVFIYIRLQAAPEKSQDVAINRLEQAGHPIVRIAVSDLYDLGQEFPLGICDSSGGGDHGPQSIRPAGCRGEQISGQRH